MRRSLGGCRLLVVGSDATADRAVHKLLHEQGCEIFGPFTLEATARAVLHQRRLDAAIIDMPLDSTAAHRLADDLVSAHVPFLWLTNPGSMAVPPRFQSHPRLLKPFNELMLLERVRRLVRGSLGRRSA
jgi:DNA-binding response OmpR family regulator